MRALIPKTLKISALPPITIANLSTSSFRSMSSQQGGRMFQLKLDPLTGNSEWVVIEEDEAPDIPSPPLLATTSYLDMLNDTRRNRAYREAIDKTVTKPCHVLDIGAGTGLLSMMAARAMDSDKSTEYSSSKGMVTACESYLPMVKLMRKVLRLNGMERKVRLINKRSDELEVGVDISSKADILVSEILDSELLGEGLIPTLQHAHDNLLVENPLTVPYRATTYAQLVESKYLWKLNDLYNNEAEVSDDIRLIPTTKEPVLCVKPQQFAMHCDAIKDEMTLLSEPFKVFEFDFWRRPESRGESKVQIQVTNDGTVHAVLSWWVLQLDSSGTIFYSTAPQWITCPSSMELHSSSRTVKEAPTGDWCDHWKQCVYFIPGKGLQVSKDGEVHLRAIHTDTNILYELESQAQEKDMKQNDSTKADPLILSPERIAIYGDRKWRSSILEAVKRALQEKESPLCVVADDSVFLTVAVARFSKKARVISLFPGLRDKGAKYLQAVAVENGFLKDQIEVPETRKKNLSMDDTRQKKVDILFGEPFYYGNDNMLPWQNLRFWNERTMLDPIMSSDALIMPCKGILKACAMYLPDLWRSRCSLGDIEGFDHSSVNTTLGACGELPAPQETLCLPYFVWQCGEHKGISETFTVMEFDFLKPISPCSGKVQVEFTTLGICHGFVLWIDWVMDEGNSIVIPTGPDQRHWKQGVKLLTNPVIVGAHGSTLGKGSVEVEAHFNPVSGQLSVHHAFK